MIEDYALLVAKLDVAFCRACGIAWPELEENLRCLQMVLMQRELLRQVRAIQVTPPFFIAKSPLPHLLGN